MPYVELTQELLESLPPHIANNLRLRAIQEDVRSAGPKITPPRCSPKIVSGMTEDELRAKAAAQRDRNGYFRRKTPSDLKAQRPKRG